ncbi:metallophosphoesterase [bacterium]|nr:metallophosphoesterase [bacterium]
MKNFFKNIFLLLIAICIAWFVYPQYTMGKTLKFAHLSDLHTSHKTAISGNRMHPNSIELEKDAIKQVNETPNLDFVVITGDGIDFPNTDLLKELGENLATLNKPYYYAIGNHDVSVDYSKEKFMKVLSKTNPYKTFDKPYYSTILKKDFKIIILDGASDSSITTKGYIDEKQLKWFDKELQESQDKVVLIFLHFPIQEPFSSHSHRITNKEEVDKILSKYSMPIAIFSGHYHVTRLMQNNNILHVSTPSMIMYPNAFRIVTVHDYKDKVVFDFEFRETNLKEVQKTSKLLTISDGLAYGTESDRINSITIYKQQSKEKKNVQE